MFDTREDAQTELRSLLLPGTHVYTILRSVSRSGESRHISLVIQTDDGIRDITWLVARAMGEKVYEPHGKWTLRVRGGGMDMGFHLVYSLSRTLYPSDDSDGGYVLRQRWL